MSTLQAIILGIIQGLTEFLPVSSSAHLVIVPWLFGWDDPGLAFDAALHLGTLVAVVVYFWRDILGMLAAIPKALTRPVWLLTRPGGEDMMPLDRDAKLGLLIVVGCIPGALAGFFGESAIDSAFHSAKHQTAALATIAIMLMALGVVLWLAEKYATHRRKLVSMTWQDAAFIGIAQMFALIPGVSRSGSTITAGLFRDLRRPDAARFSFLLGLPLILGAGLKSVIDAAQAGMGDGELRLFLIGGVTAAVVGFLAIGGLLRFLQHQSTMVFVVYRLLLGVFVLAMLVMK